MKKPFFRSTLVLVGFILVCAAEQPALTPFVRAMNGAQVIAATYEVIDPDAGSTSYSIAMAKPDLLRYETPSSLVIADGAKLTYYDKALKTFYKSEQTPAKLLLALGTEDAFLWRTFFDAKSMDSVVAARNMGKKQRGNKSLNTVAAGYDTTGENMVTLYTDSSTNLIVQAVLKQRDVSKVFTVTDMQTSAPASLFSFTPPAGSRELTEEEMAAGKWYHDWEEAVKIGRATGKTMMVDFYAVWCGPCKMMDAEVFQTKQFKDSTKDFVLVKIDAEQETGLARKYGIQAYPTVKFINPESGAVVHEYVGYGGPQQVYGEVAKARAKKK